MKKFIPMFFIVFFLFSSCASFKNQVQLAEQKAPPFKVSLRSPQVPAGRIEAQFNKAFPQTGIRKMDVDVSYFYFEDAVCLQFRINMVTYYQFWHRPARVAYLAALEKYNNDFNGRGLRNRNSKTKNQYGAAEGCYVIWQLSSFSLQKSGNMDIELGYYFREDSPFFAVTQMPASYVSPSNDLKENEDSPEIPMFLTRVQAQALAELFSQEYLQGLTPEVLPTAQGSSTEIEFDGY